MFIKPKAGLIIRDPHSRSLLPASGKEVADQDLFWHRLLNDGDVVIATKDEPKPTAPIQKGA